jgi:hypothetical protein
MPCAGPFVLQVLTDVVIKHEQKFGVWLGGYPQGPCARVNVGMSVNATADKIRLFFITILLVNFPFKKSI